MIDWGHSFYKPGTIYPFSLNASVAWYVLLQTKIGVFCFGQTEFTLADIFDEICLFLYRLTELNL